MSDFHRISAAVRSFGDLFGDLTDLFGKELRLAQSELKHGLANLTQAAVLFIATLIVGAIVNYVISTLVEKTGLSGTDRVLGICFGALRGALIVAAILFFLDTFTGFSKSEDWQKSQLIPQFSFIIRWFFDYLQSSSSFLPRA